MSDDKQHESTALQVALDIKTDLEEHIKSRDRTALVDAQRPTVRLEGSQPALYQRRVGQDPAVQGAMVHRQAAALRIMAPPEPEVTTSTTMPDEPSTPEI